MTWSAHITLNSYDEPVESQWAGESVVKELSKVFNNLEATVEHPLLKRQYALCDVIVSLNDYHKWSREQIADWLETLDVDTSQKTQGDKDE
jgi:hypothetical protein